MKEFFYDYLLPLAIQFGMSVREFWNEDPNLLWAYRKSYMDEKKTQNELANQNAWLQGLYIFDAVNKAIYNNFRKNGEAKTYIESPYNFNKSKKEREKEEQQRNEQSIREALSRMKKALPQNKN